MNSKLLAQYILPHHALSWLVRKATRWTWRPWKRWLIARVIRSYAVDMSDAAQPDPECYPTFNAFFTRALREGARHADPDLDALLCPADGRISQCGRIEDGRILQAKGQTFTAAELLADEASAATYRDGSFVTIYLSPRDYHRVHMPLDGQLQHTAHVPGRLFSVAPFTVAAIPRVFARNERLICHFLGPQGPFVVAMVGAMLVSGVQTVWGGEEIPPYASAIQRRDFTADGPSLSRFAEMARFNMGSTVIVLVPAGLQWAPNLAAETPTRLGQRLGRFVNQ
ncbi:MAG: archaetidylserine decarboxylase [Xanthomonadales bacterium]|nr:archaetidylserine decarboxylase [Xanthomonadales bacterium]